ncbi:MAG: ornithine cyclodeaminase family protein [Clostridia bacterium]|nr:ornithine cyclodeaminase family protein [Clostridia bacterium]
MKVRILNKEEIMKVIEMKPVIESVENVYTLKSRGETVVWPTTFHVFQEDKADMDIKSGYLIGQKIFGHKTVSFFADNAEKGLPTLVGVINVFDATTGCLMGVLEGAYITGMRTGAAGAIGAKYLARKDSKNVFLLGAGNQAAFQVAAILTVFPGIQRVTVYDALSHENGERFVAGIGERLAGEFGIDASGVEFRVCTAPEEDVPESDIIITVTPSRSPVIKKEWVRPGTHFSCIGSDAEGKEEIEPEIFAGAKVFVDDMYHCVEAGEVEIPIKKGIICKDGIAEIGRLILGEAEGRTSGEDITVFDATGMALLDIAAGKAALDLAEAKGLGTVVEL